jgi:dephospho-CoA kinase
MAPRVLVLGLTGSIGMGKTTVGRQLEMMGAKLCSADAIVHRLMGEGGKAVDAIAKLFPKARKGAAIDRKELGAIVFNDKQKLKQLEAILHPLVVAEENRYIERQSRLGARMVVLDIPLLYETGGQKRCDYVFVVSAPGFLQKQRVMKRAGMTEEKLRRILAAQLPDQTKRKRADFVISTGLGRGYSFRQAATYIKSIR